MSGTEIKFESGTWRVAKSTAARPVHEVGRPEDEEPTRCVFVDRWPSGWTVVQRPPLDWERTFVATLKLTTTDDVVETRRGTFATREHHAELLLPRPFQFLRGMPAEPAPYLMLGWQDVNDDARALAYRVRMVAPDRFALDGDEEGHPFRTFTTGAGRDFVSELIGAP